MLIRASHPAGRTDIRYSSPIAAAQAHILLTDPATRTEGLNLLDRTASLAAASGLSHQVSTIQSIRKLAS